MYCVFSKSVGCTFKAHLHSPTRQRLRHCCDITPKWVVKPFGSDTAATPLLPGVRVQTIMRGIYFGAIAQRRRSRWTLADQGFGEGGTPEFFPRFCQRSKVETGEWSEPILAGSRARLRALEALAFLTFKYAFSTFPGTFPSKYFLYLLGKLQNIYFNMKSSEHLSKCNFPFLYLRQSRVLICSFTFVWRYITLKARGLRPT